MTYSFKLLGRDTTNVVALDIEKTRPGKGNRPKPHTIEIGAVRLALCKHSWGKAIGIKSHFSTLIKPPVAINNVEDHGISNEMVEDAPALSAITPTFMDFVRGASFIIAHKYSSECRLFEELAELGYPSKVRFLDSMEMTRVAMKYFFKKKLKTLCLPSVGYRLRFPPMEPHRALDDAIACGNVYSLFRFLMRQADLKGWAGFQALEDKVKQFTYVKQFPSTRTINHEPKRPVVFKCRIPSHEIVLLKRLYWGPFATTSAG